MRRLALAIFALVFAAGCTGRDGAHDAGDSARGLVRIDLTYTHVASAPASDVRFDAQARFIRYRAFDPSSVPTILGFADYDALPLDGCRVADGTAELDVALGPDAAGPGAEVALLDAGRLDVLHITEVQVEIPHDEPSSVDRLLPDGHTVEDLGGFQLMREYLQEGVTAADGSVVSQRFRRYDRETPP